jgi:hypothetical protein
MARRHHPTVKRISGRFLSARRRIAPLCHFDFEKVRIEGDQEIFLQFKKSGTVLGMSGPAGISSY